MKKGALGIISFKVVAESIDPILTIDKKARTDGEYHLNYRYWSYRGDVDTPSAIQKLTYTNNTKADLIFNLVTDGPFFDIVKTKSNTNAKHPNAPTQITFT